VGALRRRGRAAIPPNIPAYFARIARNKSLDAVERGNDQPVYSLDAGDGGRSGSEEHASSDLDPHALLEGVEELSVLRDCIARLSEDEQVICSEIGLILDRRWREAAGRLEMAESTLRSRWGHILDKLRACLEKKSQKKFRA
jgi:DNA-directed RNA polymerase specialized sigma24 family protein